NIRALKCGFGAALALLGFAAATDQASAQSLRAGTNRYRPPPFTINRGGSTTSGVTNVPNQNQYGMINGQFGNQGGYGGYGGWGGLGARRARARRRRRRRVRRRWRRVRRLGRWLWRLQWLQRWLWWQRWRLRGHRRLWWRRRQRWRLWRLWRLRGHRRWVRWP